MAHSNILVFYMHNNNNFEQFVMEIFLYALSMHIENYCCMQMVYHVMDHLNTTKCSIKEPDIKLVSKLRNVGNINWHKLGALVLPSSRYHSTITIYA